jgi:oligopeptide transport system ATP-binding protein
LPDPVYEKQRTRIHYNPIAEHDYSVDTPSFREITPGHFVHCNDLEEEKYKQMVK